MLSTLDAAQRDKSQTENCCRVLFMTCWHKFLIIFNGRFIATLTVVARCVWCRHGVTNLSRKNKSTSASHRRPSIPWVLSSTGKLIRYLHESYFLPYHSADVFLFCFLYAISIFLSVMCTEHALTCLISRHAPYCWLATSLFWYSAPTQFSKVFLKNYIPHL